VEVLRGSLADLAQGALDDPPRGGVVLLVGPAPNEAMGQASLDDALAVAMGSMTLRDAAASVALAQGLPRKSVYARALELVAEKKRLE